MRLHPSWSFQKKRGVLITLALLTALPASVLAAEPYIEPAQLMLMAVKIANQHHLNVYRFLTVINCESQWKTYVQSRYPNQDGTRENSWGIAQWNLDTNNITKEEALDPQFALTKMAEYWVDGKAESWGCYRYWNERGWK